MILIIEVTFTFLLVMSIAYTTHDQLMALLQTGTQATDAIDTVIGLLNDLIQSNKCLICC
ncbi:unnamed protein product [Paramecium octaurelia]|uniref:Uncharacterized protein n=1 Tax=Paramecium octaurelia TaxID=43137 RepID=A0A8S1V7Z1_PAROT|nr:unnamed protein product [Paramecium octaurelia]